MKTKLIILIILLACSSVMQAQMKQTDENSLDEPIIPIDKQTRLANFNLILNQQYAFRNDFDNGEYIDSRFRMEQFRLEMRGWITEKVFFRFRHRYTSSYEPQSVDKIIKGVDMAYITVKLGNKDKWELSAGKLCADWGGIEFDLNPIDIYEYSDIIEQADNFLSGIGLKYNLNDRNSFNFQVLNSRTQTYDEIYGNDTIIGASIEPSKAPLGGVFSWRGSFFDGKFTTLYHYSLFNEASGIYKNYFAFGNQLTLDKLSIAYDYKHSFEDLDRTGIISDLIPRDEFGYQLRDTEYNSHWVRIDWNFKENWHLCFDGFIDHAKWNGKEDPTKTTNDIRNSYGFVPTIEYYPWNDINLKFFVGYVGRVYNYSDYTKNTIGISDNNTGRIMIGLISPLKIL
jgi:hypothetical protein